MFWPKWEAGTITALDYTILIFAQLLQLIWWMGIILGFWYGVRRYGVRFLPAYLVAAVIASYLPADNIVRYAAPMHPWLLTLIVIGWTPIIQRRLGKR